MFKTIQNSPLGDDKSMMLHIKECQEMFTESLRQEDHVCLVREYYKNAWRASQYVEKTLVPILRNTDDWYELSICLRMCARQMIFIKQSLDLADAGHQIIRIRCAVSMGILEGYLFKNLVYVADEYLESKKVA